MQWYPRLVEVDAKQWLTLAVSSLRCEVPELPCSRCLKPRFDSQCLNCRLAPFEKRKGNWTSFLVWKLGMVLTTNTARGHHFGV